MNLALNIGIGSGTQLALFVMPLLVIFGIISGHHFTLVYFVWAYQYIIMIIDNSYISRDGVINWLDWVTLTVVYVIIAVGFFFLSG